MPGWFPFVLIGGTVVLFFLVIAILEIGSVTSKAKIHGRQTYRNTHKGVRVTEYGEYLNKYRGFRAYFYDVAYMRARNKRMKQDTEPDVLTFNRERFEKKLAKKNPSPNSDITDSTLLR